MNESSKIEMVRLEAASLDAIAKEAIAKAFDLGESIAELGPFVQHALEQIYQFRTAEELREKTVRLQAIVARGHALLAELQLQAGRLDSLADVRRATIG